MSDLKIPLPENPFAGIQEAEARKADSERSEFTEYYRGPTGKIFISTGCHPSNFAQETFELAVDLMKVRP